MVRMLLGWSLKLAVPAAGAGFVAYSDNPAAQYVREMLQQAAATLSLVAGFL